MPLKYKMGLWGDSVSLCTNMIAFSEFDDAAMMMRGSGNFVEVKLFVVSKD